MSQLLVAVFNNTSHEISIWNSETSSNTANIPPHQMIVIQGEHGHFNIPDCSDQSYFEKHHMEIRQTSDGKALFSFWGDDEMGYVLKTCPGTDYKKQQSTMPGNSSLGNNANVMIQVDPSGLSAVTAHVVDS